LKQGQYKLIRVDGSETTHEGKPSIAEIQQLIGCDSLDTVTIDRKHLMVMFVDDTGIASEKDGETIQTQDYPSAPRLGTVEKRSVEFARGSQFASILWSRDR
jgi:hypothetical protein